MATPIALRYSTNAEQENGNSATFDGPMDGVSETPSFLRRTNPLRLNRLKNTNGGAESTSPIAVRMPPKIIGKGLSTLVKDLRDMEDERMDDELDVLRELENEQMGNSADDVIVGDSQVFGNHGEELPEGTEAANDQYPQRPRKQWKKKGQKRTTRRVNMKPVRSKPKPEPKWKANVDDIEEEPEDENENEPTVSETEKPANAGNKEEDADPGSDYGSLSGLEMSDLDNNDDNDDDYDTSKPTSRKKRSGAAVTDDTKISKSKKSKKDKKKDAKGQAEGKENEKPKGRKVNELAHTNFRSLKIRNRGSKARGKGGRFGRR